MASVSASERLASGLVLHRSEAVAHVAEVFDRHSRASARARGRFEGHQSKTNSPFRPLGVPLRNDVIAERNAAKLAKVEKACAQVVANVSGWQYPDAKGPARSRAEPGRSASDWSAASPRGAKGGGGDAGADGSKRDKDPDAERLQLLMQIASQPHGLFGKDLPRCRGSERRHVVDGFGLLRKCVRASEVRVQQVRTDSSGTRSGFDYGGTVLEAMLPSRDHYPAALPAEAQLSARLSSVGKAPLDERSVPGSPRLGSARWHDKVTASALPEKRSCRAQPHRLQSLEEFITSAGPATGMGGRSERSEALRLREQINELLGLDKTTTLKLPLEETSGGRRGRLDVRRRIEKRLDEVQDRAFVKKHASEKLSSIERKLQREWDDWDETGLGDNVDEAKLASMAQLATIERYCRDLSAFAEEKSGAEDRAAGGGAVGAGEAAVAERAATNGSEWSAEGGAEASERWTKRERLEEAAQRDVAKFAQVARLRAAVQAYQAAREERRQRLQDALLSMDANRPNVLRRRAALGPASSDFKASHAVARTEADGEDSVLQKQYVWYRDLLCRVQGEKQNLPRVAHFVFDCIKQVLEHGKEFRREVYFAVIEQIQDFEFTNVVAGLVVNMIRGIDDLSPEDLVAWFEQNRGEVPPRVAELLEGRGLGGAPEGAAEPGPPRSPPAGHGRGGGRRPTFAAEPP